MENEFVILGTIFVSIPLVFMNLYCIYDISPIDIIKKGRDLWNRLKSALHG